MITKLYYRIERAAPELGIWDLHDEIGGYESVRIFSPSRGYRTWIIRHEDGSTERRSRKALADELFSTYKLTARALRVAGLPVPAWAEELLPR